MIYKFKKKDQNVLGIMGIMGQNILCEVSNAHGTWMTQETGITQTNSDGCRKKSNFFSIILQF